MPLPPALVDAIREGGDAARLVAADWLIEHGEVAHGELITTMVHAPDDVARIDALIAQLVDPDLGILRAGWRAGFLDRIASRTLLLRRAEQLKGALEHPAACALRALDLHGFSGEVRVPATVRMLRAMFEITIDDRLQELVEVRGREVTFATTVLPALEELACDGASFEALVGLEAPRLALLRIDAGELAMQVAETLQRLAPSRFPALRHLAIACGVNRPVAYIRGAPIAQQLQTLEIVAGAAGERERRWFPIDRGPRDLRGLLDLGLSERSEPGRLVRLDENPGRHDVGQTRIEFTGVDWWVRDASSMTYINGQSLAHVRLLPGDLIQLDGVAYRAVGEHEDLAALRARTALPEPKDPKGRR